MLISDLSSDVCSSDLSRRRASATTAVRACGHRPTTRGAGGDLPRCCRLPPPGSRALASPAAARLPTSAPARRSEEHTSELQSLMRISYAVFCLKKKKIKHKNKSQLSHDM